MSQNKRKKITPLSHEDLELKQWMLKFARNLADKDGFENGLAGAMIYSSFTEYLAENLLENLKYFIYRGTYDQYAGILFIDETRSGKNKKTLGQNITEIEKFNFPDKEGILRCLREIVEARNNMLHQFARTDIEGLKKIILQDVSTIRTETEDLVQKIDTVYTGLRKILKNSDTNTQQASDEMAQPIPAN